MRAVAQTTLRNSSSKDFLKGEEILRSRYCARQPIRLEIGRGVRKLDGGEAIYKLASGRDRSTSGGFSQAQEKLYIV